MNIEPYIAYAKKTFLQKTAYRFDHLMNILSTCLKIFIFGNLPGIISWKRGNRRHNDGHGNNQFCAVYGA